MAIGLEVRTIRVECDEHHFPGDIGAHVELLGRTRQDALALGEWLGWTFTDDNRALCPAHGRGATSKNPAQQRLEQIALERHELIAAGARAVDPDVVALSSEAVNLTTHLLPQSETCLVVPIPNPGKGRSRMLAPTTSNAMLGRLFLLRTPRAADRIEPPGVGTSPYGAIGGLVVYGERPQPHANAATVRAWDGSLRRAVRDALDARSAAGHLSSWSLEWHVESWALFHAAISSPDGTPWWLHRDEHVQVVAPLLDRIAAVFAPSIARLLLTS